MAKWLLTFIILSAPFRLYGESETLVVGAYEFPPYMSQKGIKKVDGQTGHGIDLEILLVALERSGLAAKVVWMPAKRLTHELNSTGAVDISNTFFFDKEYPVEKQILYDMGGRTVFYKNSGRELLINSPSDFNDLTIGFVRGDYYGSEIDSLMKNGRFRISEVTTDKQNFQMLNSNRIDLLAVNADVGRYHIAEMGIADQVEPVELNFDYGLTPESGGIFIRFSRIADQDVITNMRDVIKSMVLDGSIKKIKQSYGLTNLPYTENYYSNLNRRK